MLITAGAAMNIVDEYGNTGLHLATKYGNITVIEYLIEMGHEVNVKDLKGRTPLYIAGIHHQFDCMKLLIQKGNADINILDNEGCSLLDVLLKQEVDNNNGGVEMEKATIQIMIDYIKSAINIQNYAPGMRIVHKCNIIMIGEKGISKSGFLDSLDDHLQKLKTIDSKVISKPIMNLNRSSVVEYRSISIDNITFNILDLNGTYVRTN